MTLEEEQYAPELDRFIHRLDSVAALFKDAPDTGEALAMLLFPGLGVAHKLMSCVLQELLASAALLFVIDLPHRPVIFFLLSMP